MLEDLFKTFLHSQLGDVRRRTRGAILEVVAFGLFGLAIALLFLGMFLWLSVRMEPWLAATLLASFAFLVAVVLMLVGRTLLRRKEPNPHHQALSALQSLGLLSKSGPKGSEKSADKQKPEIAMVASALAAGLILGRSTKR
jgi:integral membrane sensor domain MASE1